MPQIPEIPASAYTPEMEILGVIPDIPVFEGDRIPVSRNALTSDTRPLQFLPAPGSDFSIRHNTDAMRGFQSENKGDPAVLACLQDLSLVGTYDWASLALAHLYHGLDVWAYEYRIYPGGPESHTPAETWRIPRYLVHRYHTNTISEDPYHWRRYLNDTALADLFLTPWEGDAWIAYAPRVRAEALTRARVLHQGYWVDWYYLGERVLEIRTAMAQRRMPIAPPRHMCTLDGMTPKDRMLEYGCFPADDYLVPGDYASYLSTRLKIRLPDVREYSQDRKRHRTPAFYEAQVEVGAPTWPTGVVLGDVPFPLGMEVTLDPTLGLRPTLAIPADLRQAPPQLQLDPEHATHVLEIGRLRRHQARQAAAVSRLQMKNDRLRTRLEVEAIPLDFSDEEEDVFSHRPRVTRKTCPFMFLMEK
ncbi:hypothetical protein JCGZ_22038 [Jatropha curcas]|uniref:Aminotransferase-like plant mobile domain-containing protein n=1 Tax=Jatropha curcas TaxID=180498 RepID=A0A067K5Q1_JATCU|nr:hypothetical protein JCGZ_22038 [Jatropha curcas]